MALHLWLTLLVLLLLWPTLLVLLLLWLTQLVLLLWLTPATMDTTDTTALTWRATTWLTPATTAPTWRVACIKHDIERNIRIPVNPICSFTSLIKPFSSH